MRRVVLFGVGSGLELAQARLEESDLIVAYCDNNPSKQGKELGGVPVVAPSFLLDLEYDVVMISSQFYPEIKKQLLELKVPLGKIEISSAFQIDIGVKKAWWIPLELFFMLVTAPRSWWLTLRNSKELFLGKLAEYNCFTPERALNTLYYKTEAMNLFRFGRAGVSPTLGVGDFQMSWLWFAGIPGLFAFWIFGPLLPFFCMGGWLGSFYVWSGDVSVIWITGCLVVAGLTTTFYANTFVVQEYNVVSWMFLPLGIWGVSTGNWVFAGLAWFGTTFGGITGLFVGCWLCATAALWQWSFSPLVSLVPALGKMSLNFIPMLKADGLLDGVLALCRTIGFLPVKVRYKRDNKKSWYRVEVLNFFLESLFLVSYVVLEEGVPWLYVGGIAMFVFNWKVARFCDVQSVFITMFSLATAAVVQSENPWMLIPLWVCFSPYPWYMEIGIKWCAYRPRLPVLSPIKYSGFCEGLTEFLNPVEGGARVIVGYEDPKGMYSRLFDGMRHLNEALVHAANLKRVLAMPDFHAVYQLNYPGAQDMWGRTPECALDNCEKWSADYFIQYEREGGQLSGDWGCFGFEHVGTFYWDDYKEDLKGYQPGGAGLVWHLMKLHRNRSNQPLRVE